MRDQLAELEAAFQNPHQQRDFEAHQDPDQDHHGVQHELEAVCFSEGDEKGGRRESADDTDHQLDRDEARDQRPRQELREPAPDAHGEQVGADDGGELQDAIAQQVAGKRAGDQLIDQTAGGDQKDGEKKNYWHGAPERTGRARCARSKFSAPPRR